MSILFGAVVATQALNHISYLLRGSYLLTVVTIYLAAALLYHGIWNIILFPNVFSPLRKIDGPSSHWFYGHFREIFRDPIGTPHLKWMKQYPTQPFIRYHGLFKGERLLVNSQAALQYILTHCYDYPKPAGMSTRT